MIKTLLKHKLAETAINTFFNKVSNNFTNVNIHKFEKGQTYSRIITMYTECGIKYRSMYYGCIIRNTNITECIFIKYSGVYIIRFQSDTEYTTQYKTNKHTIIDINDIVNINV